MLKQRVGAVERDVGHAGEEIARGAGSVRRLGDDLQRLGRASDGARVRTHHDAAAGLRRNDRLVHRRRRRICGWDERSDDAHRRGNLPDRSVFYLIDDADGPHALHPFVQRPCREEVLLRLALPPSEARHFVGHLAEAFGCLCASFNHSIDDGVDLILRKGAVALLGGFGEAHHLTRLLDGTEVLVHGCRRTYGVYPQYEARPARRQLLARASMPHVTTCPSAAPANALRTSLRDRTRG